MTATPLVAAAAALALVLGLLMAIIGRGMRRRRGLGSGQTVSLDGVTLTSGRYGLTGRPDRLIRNGARGVPGTPYLCAVNRVRCWSSVGASPTRQLGRSSR
jgi:CRISPR-associated exonuclease Cas4